MNCLNPSYYQNAWAQFSQNTKLQINSIFVSQRNSSFDSRYKFTAKELDNELRSNRRKPLKLITDVRQTNYTYFGARYYDSDLSSWLSVDPMASKGPSFSPYIYCFNNPVQFVDPDGQWPKLPIIIYPWERTEIQQAKRFARATGGRYSRHPKYYTKENGGVLATVFLHGTTAGMQVEAAYAKSLGKVRVDLDCYESDYAQTIDFKERHDYSNLFAPPKYIEISTLPSLVIVLQEVTVIAPALEGITVSREEINVDGVVDILIPDVGARVNDNFAHNKKKQSTGKATDTHDKQYVHGGKNRPENPNKRKGADDRRLKGKTID